MRVFFLQVVQVRQQAVAKRKENKHAVALDCDQVDTGRLKSFGDDNGFNAGRQPEGGKSAFG